MKKFLLMFLSSVVLITTLVIPCFATLGDSYMNQPNLLDEYSTVNCIVNGFGNLQPFYYVNLEAGKDYTFYAPKGVNKLLISPIVDNPVYTFPVVYERPSYNLYNNSQINSETGYIYRTFNPPTFGPGRYKLIFTYSSSGNFDFFIQIGTTTLNRHDLLHDYVPAGSGTLEYVFDVPAEYYEEFSNNMLLFVRSLYGDLTMNMIIVADEDSDTVVYEPIFTNPFYYPYQLTIVNFHCEKTGEYAVGFNASGIDGYSRDTAADNPVVLVEGSYSFDSIVDDAFGNGYDTGYDDGYKIGENDGLSSSSMLRSIIFTILSAPFVIVSNVLDFELLGINIYNLVKVSITVLLVAWVITRLKGRE